MKLEENIYKKKKQPYESRLKYTGDNSRVCGTCGKSFANMYIFIAIALDEKLALERKEHLLYICLFTLGMNIIRYQR